MTTRSIQRLVHVVVLATAAFAAAACASAPTIRKFPARAPMWRDPDTTPFGARPAKYAAPEVWDTVDNTVFTPVVDALAIERPGRAKNVNAVDEVPDSSWFTNRIDQVAGDVDATTRGACAGDDPDPAGPWTVIAGKPNGANPGFMVQHADGRKFMFKPDVGTERQSAADLIGTRVYYAAGYNTACIRLAFIQPDAFRIAADATAKNFAGDKVAYTRAMLDGALANGLRDGAGAVRGVLSELIDGKVIGPWKDYGTRDDDPNDVIRHEDRRELRGSYVFGAWLGHYDAREQNSLDAWVETDAASGAGYVRHYMFDFGDCLGSMSGWGRVSRRRGHAYELDWSVAFTELVTFGALDRPWRGPEFGPGGKTLGYFAAEPFTPDRYRTAYPFGPYTRVTESDGAWGARILARISPDAIHALVALAKFSDPEVTAALERALLGRRTALLDRYLTKLSPLTRPRVDADQRVCVSDARIDGGIVDDPGELKVRAIAGLPADHGLAIAPGATAGEQCVSGLPTGADRPSYVVIELAAEGTHPMFVHLYTDAAGYHVAGIDR